MRSDIYGYRNGCLHKAGNSTLYLRRTTQIIIPTTHKPRSALSRSRRLTPSSVARRSENATIETFTTLRVRLRSTHPEDLIQVLRLPLGPDPQAVLVEDGLSSKDHHRAFTGVEAGGHRVVKGRHRPKYQDLLVLVSLEGEDLGQVKDRPISTFLISTMKDTIVLRNSKINDGGSVWKRKA